MKKFAVHYHFNGGTNVKNHESLQQAMDYIIWMVDRKAYSDIELVAHREDGEVITRLAFKTTSNN